jgi:protein O-mannosyl-transferase
LAAFMLLWATETGMTVIAWSDPLLLAKTLAERAPDSPRAQYELGRNYIIYSNYDPLSPYSFLAYAPLERAATLPRSTILPEQALIFMNSRMRRPIKDVWWNSLIFKLQSRIPGVQDESSLSALLQCQREGACNLSNDRMTQAFQAALSHPSPSARLYAMYGDFAWNVLQDHSLGLSMTERATKALPNEPAYHITLAHMLIASGHSSEANEQIAVLEELNIGGRLTQEINELRSNLTNEQ